MALSRSPVSRIMHCAKFWFPGLALIAAAALAVSAGFAEEPKGKPGLEGTVFFEQKIRPLLAEHCYQCHAKANGMALGGLQLDSLAGLKKGGNRGVVLDAAQPEKSRLLRAVSYQDKALLMPPKGKLSQEQIASLAAWVKMGAPFPEKDNSRAASAVLFDLSARKKQHWAWQPVLKPAPPKVKNAGWARNPIDAFVLAKLEARGLKPAAPADKRTLLRRVTFDLIGLPPTPQEITDFLADSAPNAYERVVDRLLASPHYGERWARHWLDLARYAETDGHEWDIEKQNAWQYRDYVIRAFNADVPYNQFVTEQIAGDLLPKPRLNPAEQFNESVIGTGFWWLGEAKHSPVELQEDEAERLDNQVDVMGRTFLGLSMGCARCHNHKFDAISTKDYYALCGYLKSSRFQQAAIETPEKSLPAVRELEANTAQLTSALLAEITASQQPAVGQLKSLLTGLAGGSSTHLAADVSNRILSDGWAAYLRQTAKSDPNNLFYPWAVLSAAKSPQEFIQSRDALVKQLKEQSERAAEDMRKSIVFTDFSNQSFRDCFVTGQAFGASPQPVFLRKMEKDHASIEGVMARSANSGSISDRLEGALRTATFTISKRRIYLHVAGTGSTINLIVDGYQRIRDPIYGGLTIQVKSGTQPAWISIDVSKWIGQKAYLEMLDSGQGTLALDKIVFTDGSAPAASPNPLILRMLSDPATNSLDALAEKYQSLFAETAQMAAHSENLADSPDHIVILNWMLQNRALLNPAREPLQSANGSTLTSLLERRRSLESALPTIHRAMAMTDGTPEDDAVRIRGNFKTPGDRVPRRFLEALAGTKQPAPATGSGRLELARRMTSASDPLLPRVIVNRLWLHHFGDGIVRTPDDFGVMGEKPTNRELLDWLAAVFTERAKGKDNYSCNGSLKKMHRLMVLSSAYRMASRPDDAGAERADPQNRLLHRMPVRRLEAECIRDSILQVSGRLDRTLYGPSITPYFSEFMVGRGKPSDPGPLDGAGRRSIYLGVRRNFLIPLFTAFDFPVPFNTMGRRNVSNVPAQALALMNNPFVVQQAELWAKRALSEPNQTAEQRINSLYISAYARPPTSKESAAALDFLSNPDEGYGTTNDVRSWADLCHVLINVKEFIFIN